MTISRQKSVVGYLIPSTFALSLVLGSVIRAPIASVPEIPEETLAEILENGVQNVRVYALETDGRNSDGQATGSPILDLEGIAEPPFESSSASEAWIDPSWYKAIAMDFPAVKYRETGISPGYRALLNVIATTEGTYHPDENADHPDENGYKALFGGGMFESYDRHPGIVSTRWGHHSTAAGRYQFLFATYTALVEKGFFVDGFTPSEQDLAAVYLMEQRGVTPEVIKRAIDTGNFKPLQKQLEGEWISLKGKTGSDIAGLFFQFYGSLSE